MASELSKLSGYYDRKTAHEMDYRGYMEKQAIVKDIGTAIQRSTDQQMIMTGMVGADITHRIDQSTERLEHSMVCMQTGIQTSIKAQTYAIVASQAALAHTFNQGFDRINNTLDMGFSGISSQLGSMSAAFSAGLSRISDNLKQMSKDICDRLDAIHDIVNNPLLTQSRELYRRSVLNYNKGFFEEALADIQSAVEKNKTDYISWFHLGKVYLFGASEFSNVIDLEKAIEALTTAGKYIKPDIAASNDAKLMAAEIWFYVGLAKYSRFNDLNHSKKEAEAQEIINGALEAFNQSWSLSENMFESLYNIARCKVILGNTADAIKDLETVITKDRGYCIKAVDDNDFEIIADDIYQLIERMKKAISPKAMEDFEALKPKIADTVFIGGSFADMVKNLVDKYMPETFTEDMPYFDIRDGYEMFPVILEYLNMEEYPCDRMVEEVKLDETNGGNHYFVEYDHIPQQAIIDIIKSTSVYQLGKLVPNIDKYNCSQWVFAVKWDSTKPSNKQEFGIVYVKNTNFFIPICEIKIDVTLKEERKDGKDLLSINAPVAYFQNKETLLFFTISNYRTNPIKKVFKPGIISKSVLEKAEQEAREAETARRLEATRKAKAKYEAEYEANKKQQDTHDKYIKNKQRLLAAVICIPVSLILFLMIFVFRSISIVWGSVITLAIITEVGFFVTIFDNGRSTGDIIGRILGYSITGAILGLIVGGIAWILSSFWTFTAVLWAIVMLIADSLAIFLLTEDEDF